MRVATAAMFAAFVGLIAGCGNSYRPVLATIGTVGPAGQPTRYVLAISTSTQTPAGPVTLAGLWSPATTYAISQGVSFQGAQYVSLKNGNLNQNPATATTYWALMTNGLLTMVDFSGDTVLVTAQLGMNPYYFALNSNGGTGYTLNSDQTLTSFNVSTSLISSQVLESTLPAGANPLSLFPSSSSVYLSDPGVSAIDQMTNSLPPALRQELPIAAGFSPLYVVGNAGSPRIYAITPSTSGAPGQVAAIEAGANTISTTIPVGRGPVYGVMTGDNRRAFILNQTDGTVSVINEPNNALDTPTSTIPVGSRPVWADLAPILDDLVVVNEGDGTSTPGSVTIISIPLCSATALPTNPNCNPTNPIDATSFGTVLATVPVGINPIMVTVLGDNSRAYVANAGNPALPCAANGVAVPGVSTTCTISVVNLATQTVTATVPINGHPIYIASVDSSPTGKVYVVCKDSQVMSVIETDTDSLDTTIPLQGYGISVRTTSK